MSERLDFSRMADRWRGHPSPIQDEPAVLLRDTPEDRERLAAALPDDIWKHDGYGGNGEQLADAIIAALRGER